MIKNIYIKSFVFSSKFHQNIIERIFYIIWQENGPNTPPQKFSKKFQENEKWQKLQIDQH